MRRRKLNRRSKTKRRRSPPRRSGNNTTAAQWIYFFIHFPAFWLCKIGISGNVKRRKKEEDKSVWGFYIPVFAVWVWNAYGLEQFQHRIFKAFNRPFHGSGKTEVFIAVVLPFGILIAIIWFLLTWAFLIAVVSGALYIISNFSK